MAYARLETKSAGLETEFGLGWATKLFGHEAIASLPVRASGKNKGKPKGYVIWRKAVTAGYCREVMTPLRVGGMADAWIGTSPHTIRNDAVVGNWLGRMQPMGSSFSTGVFFEEGRAKAAERARLEAERIESLRVLRD